MAAAGALKEGASALILEHADKVGINSKSVAGLIAYWPDRQKSDGWGDETKEMFITDLSASHYTHSRKGLLLNEPLSDEHPFLDRVMDLWAETGAAMEEMGVRFTPGHDPSCGASWGLPQHYGDAMPCTITTTGTTWFLASGWADTIDKALLGQSSYSELLESEVVEFIQDADGCVIGVEFLDRDGSTHFAKADKGVVLTTGSFVGNTAMMTRYLGIENAGFKPSGGMWNSGEGVRMAQRAGADLVDMDLGVLSQGGAEGVENGLFVEQYQYTFNPTDAAPAHNLPAICVNTSGKRFFAESRGNSEMGRETIVQEMGISYYVSDSALDSSWTASIPNLRWADTLEELAASIGVDKDTFLAEVERYNGFVESGTDEDFGKNMEDTTKIATAPFFAFRIEPRPYVTFGGVKTDVDSHVISVEQETIPGLYAAGICCGSIYEQEGFVYIGGIGQSLAYGYQAGRNAAKQA